MTSKAELPLVKMDARIAREIVAKCLKEKCMSVWTETMLAEAKGYLKCLNEGPEVRALVDLLQEVDDTGFIRLGFFQDVKKALAAFRKAVGK